MGSWYGMVTRDRIVRQVVFVCPRCGLDRDGSEVAPRRWAMLLGMPLVPLGRSEHVISCRVCRHRCDLGVLEIPTMQVLTRLLADATRHAVVTVIRAGEAPGAPPAVEARRRGVETMLANGFDYDDARLDADLTGLDDTDTAEALARLSQEMTSSGKQGFLHRLLAVASADDPITVPQHAALVKIGVVLGMPAEQINELLAGSVTGVDVA
jgi:hypothetical protein